VTYRVRQQLFRWSVGAGVGDPIEPDPGSASERLVLGEEVVHIPDVLNTEATVPGWPLGESLLR
jgi:hypothetical protein